MLSNALPDDLLRKKKMFVLFCGILIFFLTSMAKVLDDNFRDKSKTAKRPQVVHINRDDYDNGDQLPW